MNGPILINLSINRSGSASLRLPEDYAAKPKETLVITYALDRGLQLYTLPEWRPFEDTLLSLRTRSEGLNEAAGYFIGNSCQVLVSGNRKVEIPCDMRETVRLTRFVEWTQNVGYILLRNPTSGT